MDKSYHFRPDDADYWHRRIEFNRLSLEALVKFKEDNPPLTYEDAVALIRENSYNLQYIPIQFVDVKLLRFVKKKNIWAYDAYCPKSMRKYYNYVMFDHIIKLPFIEIDNEGWKREFEPLLNVNL